MIEPLLKYCGGVLILFVFLDTDILLSNKQSNCIQSIHFVSFIYSNH